jgi:hypothetical protein
VELIPRQVTLVLCTREGSVLGALPPFEVPVQWWQEVGPVVATARALFGIDVTVLRVLSAPTGTVPIGGPVSYLVEVAGPSAHGLLPWPTDPCAPEPLRQGWAEPGGPDADVSWADRALADLGTPRSGPAEQIRSWNLSSLWRLPLADKAAWLKVVPPFFAHEGAVLARLDPTVVPPLLAYEGPRVLLGEIPGEDCYDATGPPLLRMVELLVALQSGWAGRVPELLSLGAADFRAESLATAAADTFARTAAQLDRPTRTNLDAAIAGLGNRFAAIAECGIPDTLVHGDFHPGNVIGDGDLARLVLLDWGDCGVGHPLLDQAAFTGRLVASDLAAVTAVWSRLWRASIPGCEPERAAWLLSPVAALRQAVVYRMFLDNIEPDERVYHASDPARWLNEAATRFATVSRSK